MAKTFLQIINSVSQSIRGANANATQRPTKIEISDAINNSQRDLVDAYPDLIFTQGKATVESYVPSLTATPINTYLFDKDNYTLSTGADDILSYDTTLNLGMEAQKITIERTPVFLKNISIYLQKTTATAVGTTFRVGIVPDDGSLDYVSASRPPDPSDFVTLGIKWFSSVALTSISTTMTLVELSISTYPYHLLAPGDYWVIIESNANAVGTNPQLRIRRYVTSGTPYDTQGLNPYSGYEMSRYSSSAWISSGVEDVYLEFKYLNINYDYPIVLTDTAKIVNGVDFGPDLVLKEYPHSFEQFNGGVPPGSFAMVELSNNKLQIKCNPSFYGTTNSGVSIINNPPVIGTSRLPDIRARLRSTDMSADGDYPIIPDGYSDLLEMKAYLKLYRHVVGDPEDKADLQRDINKREASLIFDYRPRGAKSMTPGDGDSVNDATFRSIY